MFPIGGYLSRLKKVCKRFDDVYELEPTRVIMWGRNLVIFNHHHKMWCKDLCEFSNTHIGASFNCIRFFFGLQDAKKHLTQRIQHLDDKMLKQNELSRSIKDEVCS